jgi:hypothetical protein
VVVSEIQQFPWNMQFSSVLPKLLMHSVSHVFEILNDEDCFSSFIFGFDRSWSSFDGRDEH